MSYRRHIADLRRRVEDLERKVVHYQRQLPIDTPSQASDARAVRCSAKSLQSVDADNVAVFDPHLGERVNGDGNFAGVFLDTLSGDNDLFDHALFGRKRYTTMPCHNNR